MLGFLLGLFRLVWLFGKGHQAVVLENLALRLTAGQLRVLEGRGLAPDVDDPAELVDSTQRFLGGNRASARKRVESST
jgi:hypothetical protein